MSGSLNFPHAPTPGTVWIGTNGTSYIWDGTKWELQASYAGPFLPFSGPVAGYGTPTGGARLASFPGATATLAQTSAQVAQLIVDLKALGLLAT